MQIRKTQNGHSLNPSLSKNAFLTDINFNAKNRMNPKPLKHVSLAPKAKTESAGYKLPQVAVKKKTQVDFHSPQANDLDEYVEHFKQDVKRFNSVNKKSDSTLKKDDIENFNSTFAYKFLENQKKKIEDEIQQIYQTKQPKELEDYIKKFETKNTFKEILSIKKEELVNCKKTYNAYDYKLKKVREKIEKMDALLEKYDHGEKENTDMSKKVNEDKHEEIKEKIEEVMCDKEVLDNIRNTYKTDILILKKKSENLKEELRKLKKKFETKNNEIRREEIIQNEMYKKVLDHKQNKQMQYTKELINQKIKEEYTFYEDHIKFDQILANEAKIQMAKEQNEQEEKHRENEKKKEEHLMQLEQKKLRILNLQNDLQDYENKLESLQKKIHVTEESQILTKIYEHRSSKEALNELKNGYMEDIDKLKDEINQLRHILEMSLLNQADMVGQKYDNHDKSNNGLGKQDEETIGDSTVQENRLFENKLLHMDQLIKDKNQELFSKTLEFRQLNQIVLDSSSTISRIIYQLNPSLSKKLQISQANIVDLLTFVGLQLEKILSFMYIEGNLNNRNLDQDNSFTLEREGDAINKPPTWLRINTTKTPTEAKVDAKNQLKGPINEMSS